MTPASNKTNVTVDPPPQVIPAKVNGCLIGNNNYCLNSGKCGINGNCICARTYLGEQCEVRVKNPPTFRTKGIGNQGVFLICFFFLFVFPIILYLVSVPDF